MSHLNYCWAGEWRRGGGVQPSPVNSWCTQRAIILVLLTLMSVDFSKLDRQDLNDQFITAQGRFLFFAPAFLRPGTTLSYPQVSVPAHDEWSGELS